MENYREYRSSLRHRLEVLQKALYSTVIRNAKKYWDYRKMYDEMGKSIDAVLVATADHTHAMITADAMTLGKHVYYSETVDSLCL